MDYTKIDLKTQNMLAGITAQVTFVRDSPKAIYEDIKNRLQLKSAPSKVYLVGCGDSWYCGMATRFAFEEWSEIPTEAMQALEFSRYGVKFAPKDSMVVAISNSGRVSRTIECIVKANQKGFITVAGTSFLTDGLSKEAQYTIDLAYSERRFAPGTSSYMGSLMVEYCLAVYLAFVNGKMTDKQVQDKLAEISSIADAMDKTIKENMDVIEELSKKMKMDDMSVFLGGGPNYGTAFFSMAKVIEATRTNAVGQELEEWAHEQYFLTNENTTTFVLTPPGAGVTRAREQMYAIRQMGSTCVAVCDPDDADTIKEADVAIRVFGKFDEVLSPLIYCVPGELFAFHFAASHNLTMLGFDNPKIKEVNFRQIFGSNVER
jgi:glutamine---fructose-6-phosphate transaminase (isomerizing)